jgi:DNA helicase II / ATP-dependent DNA helicase PcrA
MQIIGDFHIHSKYSIATSKNLTPEWLDYWARVKGITIIATGDFTHPQWVKELKEKLEPAEQGLFRLKDKYRISADWVNNNIVRFLLTAEISNIYKKNGKTRKVHNIVWSPDFETVDKIQKDFTNRNFNISSDGRPIIGFDSELLLDTCLNINPDIFLVPAHIWTPWFSALGSKSGFDSIQECYGNLHKNIYAVETGLSSDVPMNWMVSSLDDYALLSNSDAHSPEKIGRNANIFNCELSYNAITSALKSKNPQQFIGTIDMFPQEGKYHFAGHRKCDVIADPTKTLEYNFTCPQCGNPLVLGVLNRIAQLSDREDITTQTHRSQLQYCIPLKEILSEIMKLGEASKK